MKKDASQFSCGASFSISDESKYKDGSVKDFSIGCNKFRKLKGR